MAVVLLDGTAGSVRIKPLGRRLESSRAVYDH
jgi:hypothetical protein